MKHLELGNILDYGNHKRFWSVNKLEHFKPKSTKKHNAMSSVAPEGWKGLNKGLNILLKQIMGDGRMRTRKDFIGCFLHMGWWVWQWIELILKIEFGQCCSKINLLLLSLFYVLSVLFSSIEWVALY